MMLLVAMAIFVVFAILSVPFIYLSLYVLGKLAYKGTPPTARVIATAVTALTHR
jgi:hypothetical protein